MKLKQSMKSLLCCMFQTQFTFSPKNSDHYFLAGYVVKITCGCLIFQFNPLLVMMPLLTSSASRLCLVQIRSSARNSVAREEKTVSAILDLMFCPKVNRFSVHPVCLLQVELLDRSGQVSPMEIISLVVRSTATSNLDWMDSRVRIQKGLIISVSVGLGQKLILQFDEKHQISEWLNIWHNYISCTLLLLQEACLLTTLYLDVAQITRIVTIF